MVPSQLFPGDPFFLSYLAVFAAAALACLAGAWRARKVSGKGVRRGLVALLSTSGLWASAHVGMLLAPGLQWKTAFYEAGLIVGFATVGAWLWLCSSYSGRSFHESAAVCWGMVLLFGAVTLTKLTNPWHGLYFSAGWDGLPFRHLRVDHHTVYWITAGLSYMGAAVGFFMLAEPLRRIRAGGWRLAGLFGLAALPLGANAVGYASPYLLDVSHEPIGVAAFALGALFVYRGRFEEAARAGQREKPTLVLSEGDRIRNYNRPAAALFPALEEEEAVGAELSAVLPGLQEALSGENGHAPDAVEDQVVEDWVAEDQVLVAGNGQVTAAGNGPIGAGEEGGGAPARRFRPVETTFWRGGGRLVTLADVTDQALRQRERDARMQGVADSLPGVVFQSVARPDGTRRFRHVSQRAETLLGLSAEPEGFRERLLGQVPGPHREALREAVEEAARAGSAWRREVPFEKPGGDRIWLLVSATPEDERPLDEGEVVFNGVLLDITERKGQKRRRQQTIRRVTDGIVEVDSEWRFTLVNEQAEQIYGIDEEELLGKGLWEAFGELEGTRFEEVYREVMHSREPARIEDYFSGLGGWFDVQVYPNEDGGLAFYFEEITGRKEAEEELRRSRERYRSLFEDSTDAILIHDLEGRIREANPRAEALFGREAGELKGLSIHDLHASGESKTAEEKLATLQAGETYQAVSRYERASGPTFWGEVSASVTEIEGRAVARTMIQDVTEREEGRRQLERQKEYTDRLLNASDDLFFVLGENAQFQRWNDRFPEVTGYSSAEIGEMSAFDLVPEEEREQVAAEITEALATGRGQVEVPLLRKDGTTVPYEFVGNRVEHPEGGLRVVGIGRDVTEQKRRKRRLRRQNDLFERAQEIASVGAWEYDIQTDEILRTQEARRIYGPPTGEDLTVEEGLSRYHPADRPVLREAIDEAKEGTPFDLEMRLQVGPEEMKWVRLQGEPQGEGESLEGEPEGKIARIRGTIQDVTEQKRWEKRLERRRQMVESLYDATGRLLRAKSREAVSGRIHEVLRAVFDYPFRHTGFVEGETIVPEQTEAAGDLRLPQPKTRPVDGDTVVARALRAGEAVVVGRTEGLENPIDYGDLRAAVGVPIGERGAIVVGKAHGGRAQNGDAQNGNAQEGAFDSTDLRLLEVLGSYAALVLGRLEREQELLQAKEEAEAANRMKSVFLANMSHEIRTPLTSILGFAEMIGEEVRNAEGESGVDLSTLQEFARLIEKSGERLMDTLTGVLNLSKLEAGEMDLDLGPVDLSAEAAQGAAELRPQAEEKGLRFEVESGDAPARARADAGGVQIVLRNLVSNAIKYTESGGEVQVRTYQEEGEAVLEVEDSGIGMDPGRLETLFEPFRQASEGIGRVYEGTGLGLAVTQKAVQQMGGRLEVETEKGEGTCITACLPRADDAKETRDVKQTSSREA